jgi:hypothetical protein
MVSKKGVKLFSINGEERNSSVQNSKGETFSFIKKQ